MCNIFFQSGETETPARLMLIHLYCIPTRTSLFRDICIVSTVVIILLYCVSDERPRWNFASPKGGAAAPGPRRIYNIFFWLFDHRSCAGLIAHMRSHIPIHSTAAARPRRLANALKRQKTVSPIWVDLWVSRSRINAYYKFIIL